MDVRRRITSPFRARDFDETGTGLLSNRVLLCGALAARRGWCCQCLQRAAVLGLVPRQAALSSATVRASCLVGLVLAGCWLCRLGGRLLAS
jgi:hypothetical protein